MAEKVNKHSKFNDKRSQVFKVEERKDDQEAQDYWVTVKADLKAVSGDAKQGFKDLYKFGKEKGFFTEK